MRHVGGKVYDGCVSTKAPTCSLVTVRHRPCLSPPLDLWNIPPSGYLPPDAVESPCCRRHDHQHHNINSRLVHSPLYPSHPIHASSVATSMNLAKAAAATSILKIG